MGKLNVVCVAVLVGAVTANIELDMWNAAKDGDLANVNKALAAGVNPNWLKQDNWGGRSARHAASEFNHASVVNALLDAGADKDQRSGAAGLTPIYEASYHGSTDVITTLIVRGADVNIPSVDGLTPLMVAARGGHLRIVEALLDAHANVRLTDTDGWTALQYAAGWNRPDIAQLLLQKGADARKQDSLERMTPVDRARKFGYYQLALLIDNFNSGIPLPTTVAPNGHPTIATAKPSYSTVATCGAIVFIAATMYKLYLVLH